MLDLYREWMRAVCFHPPSSDYLFTHFSLRSPQNLHNAALDAAPQELAGVPGDDEFLVAGAPSARPVFD
jgi:hypothetical protein